MKPLFTDPRRQEQLERDGYVVVPLLDNQAVERLRRIYEQYINKNEVVDLFESSRHSAVDVNHFICSTLRQELEPASRELFRDYQLLGGTFMVKAGKGSSVLQFHQDWSVVEEGEYSSLFIWCALEEVSARNGGLFVLPGSHKYFAVLRSGSYPSDRYILPCSLRSRVTDISLRAGEAIIYYDRLFHGSHVNDSGADRLVATGRVLETDAELVYFHKLRDHEVGVYPADATFYLTHIDALAKGSLPDGVEKAYSRPYRHHPVTEESLSAQVIANSQQTSTQPDNRLFRDRALQREFDENGFAVINLIEPPQVDELLSFYRSLKTQAVSNNGFQVSLDLAQPEVVKAIADKLTAVASPCVEKIFENYRLFTASFVVKERNPLGVVPPHQDWTFVDEQKHWSATIWCSLVDVDIANGGLGVLQGSHHFFDHVRPSPSPQFEPPFKDQLATIFPYVKLINLKAGQALVFDNRTIHASPPNTKADTRVAFGLGITQRHAALKHYYLLPRQTRPLVQQYDVTPEFFHSYNNARLSAMFAEGQEPNDMNKSGVFSFSYKSFDSPQLVALMEQAGNTRSEELMNAVKGLFERTDGDGERS